MGSTFQSDNSGLLMLLIGLIVVVLFGVLMTIMTDGNLSFPGRESPQTLIANQQEQIEGLEKSREVLLAKKRAHLQQQKVEAELALRKSEGTKWNADLAAARQDASHQRQEIQRLEEDFAQFQTKYRRDLWRRAAGTVVGELTTSRGRKYERAKIKKITAVEMRVEHAGGAASIPVAELPISLRDKYQLDAAEAAELARAAREEKAERLRKEAEERAAKEAEERRLAESARKKRRTRRGADRQSEPELSPEEEAEVHALVQKLETSYVLLGRLNRELASARASRGGPDRSPPGSLQTWEERISDLDRKSATAEGQISVLLRQIQRLDPRYRPPRQSRLP